MALATTVRVPVAVKDVLAVEAPSCVKAASRCTRISPIGQPMAAPHVKTPSKVTLADGDGRGAAMQSAMNGATAGLASGADAFGAFGAFAFAGDGVGVATVASAAAVGVGETADSVFIGDAVD